jgi:hypothetical protein
MNTIRIWVYNFETNETKKIFDNGYNPQWAPHRNIVAFQDHRTLDISTYEPLPPSFHEEVGVSYHLHQRSFCAEEGGLLLLDAFIGSLLDGSSKQHRHHTDGAVQPFYYFLLTQSVDTSASFARSNEQRYHAEPCLRYFALHEHHDAPHTHTGTQTGGKIFFFSFGRQED